MKIAKNPSQVAVSAYEPIYDRILSEDEQRISAACESIVNILHDMALSACDKRDPYMVCELMTLKAAPYRLFDRIQKTINKA
jgi:hypothetical protein